MKITRHARILELVERYDIGTQEELADYLNKDGFQVTQATISRDIRELKLTKVQTPDGRQKYAVMQQRPAQQNEKYLMVLRQGLIAMDQAGNLLVIRTVSGMAMAVAAALDEMKWPELAGCIAGDDTVFCAVHTPEETSVLEDRIRQLLSR